MKAKIIEIQNKIEAVNTEIEQLETLALNNQLDKTDLEKIISDSNEQRNELLIAEKFGVDNKAQIAEIDKIIKSAKVEIEKRKEKTEFLKSIKKKIDGKHDAILKLNGEHKTAIADYIHSIIDALAVERDDALLLHELKIKEIAAYEAILGDSTGIKRKVSGSLDSSLNDGFIYGLWRKYDNSTQSNIIGESVGKLIEIYKPEIEAQGINL